MIRLSHAQNELALYIAHSNETIYRQLQRVHARMRVFQARGTYDRDRAVIAYSHVTAAAARAYTRDLSSPGQHGSYGCFSATDRRLVAASLRDEFEAMGPADFE